MRCGQAPNSSSRAATMGALGSCAADLNTCGVMPLYVGHIELVGILNGCTKYVRMPSITIAATRKNSTFSTSAVFG